GNLVGPVAARGEDQDWKGPPGLAPAADDRQPVKPRKAEIDDRDVIVLDIAVEPRLLTVACMVGDETRRGESANENRSNRRIILDHQCPHQSSSTLMIRPVRASISTSRTRPFR